MPDARERLLIRWDSVRISWLRYFSSFPLHSKQSSCLPCSIFMRSENVYQAEFNLLADFGTCNISPIESQLNLFEHQIEPNMWWKRIRNCVSTQRKYIIPYWDLKEKDTYQSWPPFVYIRAEQKVKYDLYVLPNGEKREREHHQSDKTRNEDLKAVPYIVNTAGVTSTCPSW